MVRDTEDVFSVQRYSVTGHNLYYSQVHVTEIEMKLNFTIKI